MRPELIDKKTNKNGEDHCPIPTWVVFNSNDNSPNLANNKDINMKNYLRENFPKFYDNFELTDYIGSNFGNFIYTGRTKNNADKIYILLNFLFKIINLLKRVKNHIVKYITRKILTILTYLKF